MAMTLGDVLVFQPILQPLGLPVGLIGGQPGEQHPAAIAQAIIIWA